MRRSPGAIACLLVAGAIAGAPADPAVAQDAAPERVAPAVRNVTPPGITPGPTVDGPLIRIPTPPAPPEPPRWRRFFLPETTDAATFLTDRQIIRVYGVSPPAPDAVCRTADGEWPCGRAALHSLRMFLRGRAVECLFPPTGDIEQVIAPCRVGATDLGLWLLEQGWAEPSDLADAEYRKAADIARCTSRGIWRGAKIPDICQARPPS